MRDLNRQRERDVQRQWQEQQELQQRQGSAIWNSDCLGENFRSCARNSR